MRRLCWILLITLMTSLTCVSCGMAPKKIIRPVVDPSVQSHFCDPNWVYDGEPDKPKKCLPIECGTWNLQACEAVI